ncbi:MAG: alpha/beta hydrolase, partial [Acetobacteraceae bacterium]|nr:alpha/beta hydrolase [Acetobacteraceae bacterium]
GASSGVYVWAHGVGGGDNRGLQPQPHVRLFNNIGFDVIRFDRCPSADETERAAGWLRDGLVGLRQIGWRRVIVGGQSRGAWNALQMMDTPGLADVIVAISPAAQGEGGSPFMSSQTDELRRIVDGVETASASRLGFVQFEGDTYIGDPDRRRELIEQLRPRLARLMVIDRPVGFSGHFAGGQARFAEIYGPALLGLALPAGPLRTADRRVMSGKVMPGGTGGMGSSLDAASPPQPPL